MEIISYSDLSDKFFEKIEFENIQSVSEIIDEVRKNGDKAVSKYSKQFGDGDIEFFEVSQMEISVALEQINKDVLNAIKFSIENVREFSQKQLDSIRNLDTEIRGNNLGHKIVPLESVGCYIPGGNYPLLSSAVMTIVPAKVAGVKNIVAVSPKIRPETIVACALSGTDKIFKIGGVQGIAALAYGTDTIPKVAKIVGPGNKFVTSAKKQVFGECGIDFLAGPSEVLIIADEYANSDFVAADMLAQCEHDKDARAYLICNSMSFALEVEKKAQDFLEKLETKEIAKESFEKSIAVVLTNLDLAVELANKKAPEHLELCVKNPEHFIDKLHNYGSLFVGDYSAEVFGDYVTGTNHTLPTNQVARYSGGLSVFDYIKIQTYQMVGKTNLLETAKNASIIAQAEGLFAHKLASDIRLSSNNSLCE